MSTIAEVAGRVAERWLKRTDLLADCVAECAEVYRLIGARVPFDSLQQTSAERAVLTSTASYSLADLEPRLAGIVSIRMSFGNNRVRRLKRSHARLFDQLNPAMTGEPAMYARWGDNIEFNCLPNRDTYTYRVRYWSRPTLNVDVGATVLLIPEEWEELLMWETLYRMYYILDQPEKAQSLVMTSFMPQQPGVNRKLQFETAIIPRLWNDLLRTVSQREAIDEDFSMAPTVRSIGPGRG